MCKKIVFNNQWSWLFKLNFIILKSFQWLSSIDFMLNKMMNTLDDLNRSSNKIKMNIKYEYAKRTNKTKTLVEKVYFSVQKSKLSLKSWRTYIFEEVYLLRPNAIIHDFCCVFSLQIRAFFIYPYFFCWYILFRCYSNEFRNKFFWRSKTLQKWNVSQFIFMLFISKKKNLSSKNIFNKQ